MARKRKFQSVDLSSMGDDEDEDFQVQEPYNISSDEDTDCNSDDIVELGSEDEKSTDSDEITTVLYAQYVKERKKLNKLKAKICDSMRHKDKNCKPSEKPKDAFTRFSATYFSRVINALSPERKKVIEGYGFGSLLKFERCFVPNKFAQWIARQINYKTGDIVVKPSLIPFTRDSVHYVLDLPLGEIPFPKDHSTGKVMLLSKFNLQSMPTVKYFGNKLMKSGEQLSDEDVFVCFILVALNCFLCPNSSLFPASKYLGIFEHLDNIGRFEWCQFIIDWMLDAVRTFNKCKTNKDIDPPSLGGCHYLLAVYYLDFLDFGPKQVQHGLPRILYWKNSMIKEFSDLDEVSPGVYGFRPVMDISRTCYSKQAVFLHNNPSYSSIDADFLDKLDENSRCILPKDLKVGICNLLEEHSLKSALNFSMQITSLSSLSDDLKKSFATLLEHAYSVDSRAQQLVLKLLKLLTEYEPEKSQDQNIDVNENSQHLSDGSMCKSSKPVQNAVQENSALSPKGEQYQTPSHNNYVTFDNDNHIPIVSELNEKEKSALRSSQPNMSQVPSAKKSCIKQSLLGESANNSVAVGMRNSTPGQSNTKISNADAEIVMRKLTKQDGTSKEFKTPTKSVVPTSSHVQKLSDPASQHLPNIKRKSRMEQIRNYVTETDIASLRNPVEDDEPPFDEVVVPRKKCVKFLRDNGDSDVIYLDNANDYVPQFGSPRSPRRASKYVFEKRSPSYEGDPETSTPQTPMTMVTLEDSPICTNRVTPLLSQPKSVQNLKMASNKSITPTSAQLKISPECQIIGQSTVFDKATEMNKKVENMYNSTLQFANASSSKKSLTSSGGKYSSPHDLNNSDEEHDCSEFKARQSSTGGKLPHYGPRRPIYPTNNNLNFVADRRSRFRVSDTEMKNYRAMIKLTNSDVQDVFAVHIGGVKCTYRSFGDSLKPGGFVNSFVVNVFCRHLFMKPHGHPDVTKKHYFFSTIADNLLKHPHDADQDVLQRAFTKSRKARPLPDSNMLFFPVLFENHWSVFVVDIKDQYFVFLDSFYNKDDQYQEFLRDRLIPSFQTHWDKYVQCDRDMKFDLYRVIYPPVPRQPEENLVDSGVIVLMILQYWESPRTILSSIFDLNDIPKIRVKIANDLMFFPLNNGAKRHVLEYVDNDNRK